MNCSVSWCTRDHSIGDPAEHWGLVESFAGVHVVAYLTVHPAPKQNELGVRVAFGANRQNMGAREHDVTPQAAMEWAEVLNALDVRDVSAFALALYRAGLIARTS
ncbi:hypothetical protein [Nonomuraea endophytica]|uniref:hypothetical protein n=1 Tax=Nonomuraea endophytica TaxID=714136 RepID=UPI0037C6C9D8